MHCAGFFLFPAIILPLSSKLLPIIQKKHSKFAQLEKTFYFSAKINYVIKWENINY